jgi:hypothetical protein
LQAYDEQPHRLKGTNLFAIRNNFEAYEEQPHILRGTKPFVMSNNLEIYREQPKGCREQNHL